MKTITQNIKIIILGLVVALGVGYASAAWTPAPGTPPNSNADAPINVGSNLQTKLGSLVLGGLGVGGDFTYLPTGVTSVLPGKILIALNASGKVGWGDAPSAVTNTIYDSGWQPVAVGTPITLNHNLGTDKLIVQMFTSAVASGANPTVSNSYFQNEDYTSGGNEVKNTNGGIVITGITNSAITINAVSNKVATLQRSGQYLSNVAKMSFSYVRVLATKAAPGTVVGSRKVYSWKVSSSNTNNSAIFVDYRFGTLINKDCPPYTYKTYDYFLDADINPKVDGNTSKNFLITTAPDYDFPFTCTTIVSQ